MRVYFHVCISLLIGILISSCEHKKDTSTPLTSTPKTEKETSRIPGWHGYNSDSIGEAWQYEDGVISFDKERGSGGDIVTDQEYEDFELSLEWKISACGNSGIFWNIVESPDYGFPWLTGPEMQVLDNSCHPDAEIKTHRAGDLYDMIETSEETVKPAGSWNLAQIRSKDHQVTFSLNGMEVVSFTMHDDKWDDMVTNSKFKTMPAFGKATKGRIGLQDHSDKVWFRNISIKEI